MGLKNLIYDHQASTNPCRCSELYAGITHTGSSRRHRESQLLQLVSRRGRNDERDEHQIAAHIPPGDGARRICRLKVETRTNETIAGTTDTTCQAPFSPKLTTEETQYLAYELPLSAPKADTEGRSSGFRTRRQSGPWAFATGSIRSLCPEQSHPPRADGALVGCLRYVVAQNR
jgi:hypothetical protein